MHTEMHACLMPSFRNNLRQPVSLSRTILGLTAAKDIELAVVLRASDSPATYGALQMCFDWLIGDLHLAFV